MKKFLETYRSTKLTSRLIILAALTLLASAVAFATGNNILLYAGVTVIAGLVVEAVLKYSRKTVLLILWVSNLFVLSYFVYTIFLVSLTESSYDNAVLNAGLVAVSGLLSMVVAQVLSSTLPTGPRWVNLLICFAVYYLATISLIGLFSSTSVWVLSFISILVVVGWCLLNAGLRTWVGRIHARKQPERLYPKNRKTTVLEGLVGEVFADYKIVPNTSEPRVYFNDTTVFVVVWLASEEGIIELVGNKLTSGTEDYTWVLEDMLKVAKNFSRNNKIPGTKIKPVLVMKETNHGLAKTVQVRKRSNPDKILGTVMITNVDKLNRVVRSANNNGKEFSLREQNQLQSLSNGFDNIL